MHILLTKSDKLNRGPASAVLQQVKNELKAMKLEFSIQLFSSSSKQGVEELAMVMAGRLNYVIDADGKAINPIQNTLDAQESVLHPDIQIDDYDFDSVGGQSDGLEGINIDDIPEFGQHDLDEH